MAIQDYIPKLDVGYDANQAYANANDSMRNIGQIQKATADTTAQGWKALQDAFNAFTEQNIQNRGLDIKNKDVTQTGEYQKGDLANRNTVAEQTKTDEQAKNAFNMWKANMEIKEAQKNRDAEIARARIMAGSREKDPEALPPLSAVLLETAKYDPTEGIITYNKVGDKIVDRNIFRKQFSEDAASKAFDSALMIMRDDKMKKAYKDALMEWYRNGTPIPASPASNPGGSSNPAKQVPYVTDEDFYTNYGKEKGVQPQPAPYTDTSDMDNPQKFGSGKTGKLPAKLITVPNPKTGRVPTAEEIAAALAEKLKEEQARARAAGNQTNIAPKTDWKNLEY